MPAPTTCATRHAGAMSPMTGRFSRQRGKARGGKVTSHIGRLQTVLISPPDRILNMKIRNNKVFCTPFIRTQYMMNPLIRFIHNGQTSVLGVGRLAGVRVRARFAPYDATAASKDSFGKSSRSRNGLLQRKLPPWPMHNVCTNMIQSAYRDICYTGRRDHSSWQFPESGAPLPSGGRRDASCLLHELHSLKEFRGRERRGRFRDCKLDKRGRAPLRTIEIFLSGKCAGAGENLELFQVGGLWACGR